MTTGQRIKKIRKEKGLTQKALGELCGIAEPTIRQYESGRLNPKIETVEKIAVALGVLPNALIPNNKWQISQEIADTIKKGLAFYGYLENLGYSVEFNKVGESETGQYVEHEENGVVIGKSWFPDEEYAETILTKDGKTAIFNHDEFQNIQSLISDIVDVQFFKKIMKEGDFNAKEN